MTLLQLEVFYTVYRCGSFTKAGEQLQLSQSAVSHALKSLEGELGMQLLIRNKSGIRATAFGEKVLAHAAVILKEKQSIEEQALLQKELLTGSVTIGSFPSASFEFLPRLLRRFHQTYPQVAVRVLEGRYEEIERWLQAGQADVGFLNRPGSFEVAAFFRDEYQLIVPEGHTLAAKQQISVERLHEEPFIMPLAGCEKVLQPLFKANKVQPSVVMEAEFTSTVMALVRSGLGVSVIPSSAPRMDGIRALSFTPKLERELVMAVPSMQSATPAAKCWVDMARNMNRQEDSSAVSRIVE